MLPVMSTQESGIPIGGKGWECCCLLMETGMRVRSSTMCGMARDRTSGQTAGSIRVYGPKTTFLQARKCSRMARYTRVHCIALLAMGLERCGSLRGRDLRDLCRTRVHLYWDGPMDRMAVGCMWTACSTKENGRGTCQMAKGAEGTRAAKGTVTVTCRKGKGRTFTLEAMLTRSDMGKGRQSMPMGMCLKGSGWMTGYGRDI
mmetsp:Transcript_32987/g.53525  ORF Transcript_32987/g.53525 Transcript_32987/m.53525 type:complete len:202 (+) Transcript_32987:947-1552(+)